MHMMKHIAAIVLTILFFMNIFIIVSFKMVGFKPTILEFEVVLMIKILHLLLRHILLKSSPYYQSHILLQKDPPSNFQNH